jgi:hypothetical protein
MVAVGSASATTINIPTSFGVGVDTAINLGSSSGLNKGNAIANGDQEVSKGSGSAS